MEYDFVYLFGNLNDLEEMLKNDSFDKKDLFKLIKDHRWLLEKIFIDKLNIEELNMLVAEMLKKKQLMNISDNEEEAKSDIQQEPNPPPQNNKDPKKDKKKKRGKRTGGRIGVNNFNDAEEVIIVYTITSRSTRALCSL